jgi:threonine dehydrogenase-like Zn-dependent dehydrogenase
MLREMGWEIVFCTDVNTDRLEMVKMFGGIGVLATQVENQIHPNSIDCVIEVAGVISVVSHGVTSLRSGGTYVFVGLVHPNSALGSITVEQIIRKCLHLYGIHNYAPRHLHRAVEFLSSTYNRYPYDLLVAPTHFRLNELDVAMEEAAKQRYHRVCVRWDEEGKESESESKVKVK